MRETGRQTNPQIPAERTEQNNQNREKKSKGHEKERGKDRTSTGCNIFVRYAPVTGP